eukprot:9132643-Pyramimonas_sp.AAC.1
MSGAGPKQSEFGGQVLPCAPGVAAVTGRRKPPYPPNHRPVLPPSRGRAAQNVACSHSAVSCPSHARGWSPPGGVA